MDYVPVITDYVVDGYGGSYYDIRFPIPVYNGEMMGVLNTTSWSELDRFNYNAVSSSIINSVSFGVCLVTLLNVVVLTPQSRRRLPLHSFVCLALVFQVIRNAVEMALSTKSISSSAYVYLTQDFYAVRLSHTSHTLISLGQISACLAFIFVQICFFLQARVLMTWLKLHFHAVYYSILTLLVVFGLVALGFRADLAVTQILDPFVTLTDLRFRVVLVGMSITYAISLGSWSLVFFVSTMSIIITRRRTLFKGNGLYDTALRLVAMIGFQSFILPIIFCVLRVVPEGPLTKSENLIIPSVLFLLPMGSLFLTVHSNESVGNEKKESVTPIGGHQIQAESGQPDYMSSRPLDPSRLLTASQNNLQTKRVDPIEAELASIDAIGELHGTSSTNSYLLDRQADTNDTMAEQTLPISSRARVTSHLFP